MKGKIKSVTTEMKSRLGVWEEGALAEGMGWCQGKADELMQAPFASTDGCEVALECQTAYSCSSSFCAG